MRLVANEQVAGIAVLVSSEVVAESDGESYGNDDYDDDDGNDDDDDVLHYAPQFRALGGWQEH